ncbi:MAG: helix-turn-helix domain-containing protein [Candidatus Obscuribacterales bacterium]|nr:helix-turn-helix domain-containing protein [Candidatus Obscuribacterales bacterium]
MTSAASTKTKTKTILIDPERQANTVASDLACFVIKVKFKDLANKHENSFLLVPIETFAKHAPKILTSYSMLRVIFVLDKRHDGLQKIDALLDKIVQAHAQKVLPKLFVTGKFEDVNRILYAWRDGVQNDTIAEAWIDGDSLVLKTCALERLTIAFDQLPWLAQIPIEERSEFSIERFGNHVHWTKSDVHLNVDAIRCAVDGNFRRRRDIEALTKNELYGKAVAYLRKQRGISQQEIMRMTGVTDRQLRRVERQGHSLTTQMVEHLAKAHGMSQNEYLSAVAHVLQGFKK